MTEEKGSAPVRMITFAELSDRWGVAIDTLLRQRKDGLLPVPVVRLNSRVLRINLADVVRYEQLHTEPALWSKKGGDR
jgi:predicted site-specific integrase-resolvase